MAKKKDKSIPASQYKTLYTADEYKQRQYKQQGNLYTADEYRQRLDNERKEKERADALRKEQAERQNQINQIKSGNLYENFGKLAKKNPIPSTNNRKGSTNIDYLLYGDSSRANNRGVNSKKKRLVPKYQDVISSGTNKGTGEKKKTTIEKPEMNFAGTVRPEPHPALMTGGENNRRNINPAADLTDKWIRGGINIPQNIAQGNPVTNPLQGAIGKNVQINAANNVALNGKTAYTGNDFIRDYLPGINGDFEIKAPKNQVEQEPVLTPYETYMSAPKEQRHDVYLQMANAENAQDYINQHWEDTWKNLPERKKEAEAQKAVSDAYTSGALKRQEEAWAGITSNKILQDKHIYKGLLERPDNYNDYSEDYDRELYDAYYGKGAYDTIMRRYESDPVGARQDWLMMVDNLKELWRDVDSGAVMRVYEAENEMWNNEPEFDIQQANSEYYGKELKEIERQEANQTAYNALMEEYEPLAAQKYFIPEYDRGQAVTSEDEIARMQTQTDDVNRIYSFLGGGVEYTSREETFNHGLITNEYNYAMAMNETEKGIFMGLCNKAYAEGREPTEAKEFLEGLKQSALLDRYSDFEKMYAANIANEDPVSASLGSLALKQANTYLDIPRHIAGWLGDKSVKNPNSHWYLGTKIGDVYENTVAENLGGMAGKVYRNVMNTASNMIRAIASPGSSKLAKSIFSLGGFFLQVDQEATARYLEDYDYETASILGAVDGLFEVAEEFLPFETMLGSEGMNLGLAFIVNGLSEMGQEFTGATALDEVKSAITGINERNDRVNEILHNGFYYDDDGNPVTLANDSRTAMEQAILRAGKEKWNEAIESGLAGLFGGTLGGVYGPIAQFTGTGTLGKNTVRSGIEKGKTDTKSAVGIELVNKFKLVEAAEKMADGTDSKKIAAEIRETWRSGKRVNYRQFGKLVRSLVSESNEYIQGIVLGETERIIQEDFERMGVKKNKIDELKESAVRLIAGTYTEDDIKALVKSRALKSIIKKYSMADQKWNEFTEAKKEIEKKSETLASVREVVDGMVHPVQEGPNRYDAITKDAAVATQEELDSADGERTNNYAEAIVKGTISDITGISVNKQNGKQAQIRIQTADGRTVDAADVQAVNMNVAKIIALAQKDGGRTTSTAMLNTLLKHAETTDNMPEMINEAQKIRWAVIMDQAMPKTKLTKDVAAEILQGARDDYAAAEEARLKNNVDLQPGKGRAVFNGKEYGTEEFDEALKGLNAFQRREATIVAKMAKKAGLNLEIINDPTMDATFGKYKGGARIMVNLAGTNSFGTYHSVVVSLGHEITHMIEENSREGYAALRKYVLNSMAKTSGFLEERIQAKMNTYSRIQEGFDIYDAVHEVVADACDQILTNRQAIRTLIKDDPSLFGKIKEAVDSLLAKIRDAMESITGSASNEARAFMTKMDQLADLWSKALEEVKGVKGTGELSFREQFSERIDNGYDYTKSFSQQVNDCIAGLIPAGDSLLVGETPQLYIKIGLPDLPVTINQKHVEYAIKGNYANPEYREGHIFDPEEYGRLPEIIKKPIAIIQDPSSTKEIIAYVEMTNTTGKPVIMPFRFGTENTVGGVRINVNRMKTVFADNDGIGVLEGAIKRHTTEKPAVYYLDKEKALEYPFGHDTITIVRNGLSGLISMIPEKNRVVKSQLSREKATDKILNNYRNAVNNEDVQLSVRDDSYMDAVERGDMETAQRLVDEAAEEAGYTYKAFHGTTRNFNTFRFTEDDLGIHLGTKGQARMMAGRGKDARIIEAYVKLNNPIHFERDLGAWEGKRVAKELYDMSIITEQEAENALLSADRTYRLSDAKATKNIRDLLISKGYDGFVYDNDFEGYSKKSQQSIAVFDPSQIKVADPVTYDDNGNVIPLSERFNRENADIRYSVRDDNYMDAVNNGDMETAQRLVDEAADKAGYTIRGYHGTSARFNTFDIAKAGDNWNGDSRYGPGFYFAHDRDTALRWTDGMRVINARLSMKNPLDLRKPAPENIVAAINERAENSLKDYDPSYPITIEQFKANVERVRGMEIENPAYFLSRMKYDSNGKMTDGIHEFLERLGYDGIITDEEMVVFSPEQIKNADPVVYDDQGKVIPLSERFNRENEDIRFSMRDAVEVRSDGLIAVHNLNAEELMKTLQLGGFPMPSIAVIRSNYAHNRYGDISVVFYPGTIDPKSSRYNKVYGGDAWTPTYPSVEYKVSSKALRSVMDRIRKAVPETLREDYVDLYPDNIQQQINRSRGDVAEALKNNLQMQILYLTDKGQEISYPTKTKNLARYGNYSNEQVLYALDAIGEETAREAYDSGFSGAADNAELIEKIRKALNQYWKEEIARKMPESKSKLARLELYSKDNFGAEKVWNLLEGTHNYLTNGISSETDVHALRDQVKNQIDQEDYENWLRSEFGNLIEKSGLRNNKGYYTDSGNPRSWEQLHDEETIENVVRIMRGEMDKGSNAFFGQSAMLALGTRDFRSLADIRAHKEQLQHISDEEMSAAKTQIVEEFGKLMDEMAPKSERNIFIARDRALDAMVDAVRHSKKAASIQRDLQSWGLEVPADAGQRIEGLLEQIANLPTEYFEAKPQRAVGFDEIAKVILPAEGNEELKAALDERGIAWEEYDGTDEDRLRALNEQEDAKFSVRDEMDFDVKHWMMSVNENSLQTEAEKVLLRQFKDLNMKEQLYRKREEDYRKRIQALESRGEENLDKDAKYELQGLRVRLANATKIKEQTQAEMGRITSSEGYGRMMRDQNRIFNDFMYGKTQAEVTDAVERLEKSSREIEKIIRENQAAAAEMEKSEVIQRLKKALGRTTIDQAAADLKKAFQSTWTRNEIKTYLEPILVKLANGESIESDVATLAGILIESDSRNTYENLSALRGLTIRVGRGMLKELRAQNSSIKEIRARLAGTGITVVAAKEIKNEFGDTIGHESSTLEQDIESLREEYPGMPEFGNDKDALWNFVAWVEGMKRQSGAQEFYDERLAEAMATIMQKVVGTASGIYIPAEARAQAQVLELVEYVKTLQARTEAAERTLEQLAQRAGQLHTEGLKAAGMANTLTTNVNEALEYFNTTAKLAVAQAKQNRQNQIIDQLKSDFAKKMAKSNEEWRNLIERDRNAREQAEQNRKYRNQIRTVLKRAYNKLRSPKGMDNVPEYMQGLARELIGTFVDNDLAGGMRFTDSPREALQEIRRVLDAWDAESGKFNLADLNDAEEVVATIINQDLMTIYDGIAAINGEVRGKNKLDTLQQRGAILQQIQEATSEIWSAIRAENTVQVQKRRIAVEDQAYKIATAMGNRQAREWTGKAGNAIRAMRKAIVSGNMTPEYFFRTLKNAGLTDLWENYHEAENRNGLELAKAKAKLAEIAEKYGYETWDTDQKVTLTLASGHQVKMTVGQLMSLYATWKREMTLGPDISQHLAGGGFFAEQDTRDGILGREVMEKRAHRISVTKDSDGNITGSPDMAMVESMLTKEQVDFVNEVVAFMSNDMSELGNEASMAAYGIKLYKESYYFPFQMWDGVRSRKSSDAGAGANADQIFHPSFSKSRLHGANNAVVIGDFMRTATDHIAGMINYATMGLANESLQKTLNTQLKEDYGPDEINKRNIWAMMEETYGRDAVQYLRELQQQLNGGAVRTTKSIGDKAITLFRKNAVAGSLSVAFQQPLSYIRAAMMISPRYLTRALAREYWQGSYKELMAHSGVAVIKDMGRFDMNFGQSARDYLTPDGLESRGRRIWNGITETATVLPVLMDRWTWTRMWVAVKAEQHALHPEMDMKSAEFLDLCGVRFNDIMRRTQVYDSTLVKSANMRSDNYFVKSLTSFMAEPTVTMNVLADAVRSAVQHEEGSGRLVRYAAGTFVVSAVMQALIKALFSSGRTPDEKKTWAENFLYRFGGNLISEMDPLQLIPGYSDLITLLKDGKLNDDAMGAIGKIYTSTKGVVDMVLGNKEFSHRNLEDSIGQLVQLFTGLPAKNIMRDGRAMYNLLSEWTVGNPVYAQRANSGAVIRGQFTESLVNADNLIGLIIKELGEAGYETNNAAYYERIYQAKKEGRDEDAQDLIDYLLLGKGVKQSAIDNGVKKAAKADEDASVSETAEFMMDEGADAGDYIKEQLKNGEIDAKEATTLLKKRYPDKSDDEIFWMVDRIEYQKETGNEVSGQYYRFYDAMETNKAADIQREVKTMLAHGMKPENIKTQITKKYKPMYLAADNKGKTQIRDEIHKAYKALGYSAEDADKVINKWK